MKLYELKPSQRFKCDYYDPKTDKLALTITARLIKLDEGVAEIELDFIKFRKFMASDLEVEVIGE